MWNRPSAMNTMASAPGVPPPPPPRLQHGGCAPQHLARGQGAHRGHDGGGVARGLEGGGRGGNRARKLHGARQGQPRPLLWRGTPPLQRPGQRHAAHQVVDIDADADKDVEGGEAGLGDGDEARVAIVDQCGRPRRPRPPVVHAAGAVGDVPQHDGGAGDGGGEGVGQGEGKEEEAFGELQRDAEAGRLASAFTLRQPRGPLPPQPGHRLGQLELVVGGEGGEGGQDSGVGGDVGRDLRGGNRTGGGGGRAC